jgi:nucleotide-binding universal stress UspA family protein
MKILILMDGSLWSHKAALHAMTIAKRKQAEVTFFSVLDHNEAKAMAFNFCTQSDMCDRIKNYEEQIWRDMKKSITNSISEILFHYNSEDIVSTSKIVEGVTREEIIAEANKEGYGLVVMGAYGKNAKTRVGRLFAEISGDIDIPILIIH